MRHLVLVLSCVALFGCDEELAPAGGPTRPDLTPAEAAPEAPVTGCLPARTLTCGEVVLGDTADPNAGTTDVVDGYALGVGNYRGAELAYAFVAPADGELGFRLTERGDADHDVFVLEEVCDGAHAVARAFNSGRVEVREGQTYYLAVDGYDGGEGAFELQLDCAGLAAPPAVEAPCAAFDSDEQEQAPVQRAAAGLPEGIGGSWVRPTTWTSWVAFAGTPGQLAQHEGIDWIHRDESVADVPVVAAGAGTVAYVRTGCGESDLFERNQDGRECGSGWGNHVVVEHAPGVFTRYAHLRPDSVPVAVGDAVTAGQRLGAMGNSGRSETRHLHFELGTLPGGFDSCAPTRSFQAVHDPGLLPGI